MNKSELVDHVAATAGLTKVQATAAVDAMFNGIMDTVAAGSQAAFVGFGTFKADQRPARAGRNPKTGETIQIAASTNPKFSAGASFKKKVNG